MTCLRNYINSLIGPKPFFLRFNVSIGPLSPLFNYISWELPSCHNAQESGTRRHGVHKTRGFNHSTWNTGDVGTAGKTFNNRQTLTGRTGAFKDRVTRELRRHTWNQINNQHEGKTRSQGAHGEQNHNKTVQGRDTSNHPVSECFIFVNRVWVFARDSIYI